jgi:hypothetical protein
VGERNSLRITENSRLATAAPAIVKRMINRRRPRVFRPESPFRKGSKASNIVANAVEDVDGRAPRRSKMFKEQIASSGSKLRFVPAIP